MAIDRLALDKLREIVGGNEADLVELIDSFLEEAPEIVEVLAVSQRSSDLSATRRAAHSLKSNARDMGARELADICARLEAQCVAGELPGPSDVDAARVAFVEAVDELRGLFPASAHE